MNIPQPTQAHLDKATYWIVKRPSNVSHQIDSLAQLIADSEARAVERATAQLRSELAAEREKVRVLRDACGIIERKASEDYDERDPLSDVGDIATKALAATKEASK